MEHVAVEHLGGDRFAIEVRDHVLTVDQTLTDGGEDAGPTPTEMFVGAIAACVAHYAHRYLARHQLPTVGFAVRAEYELAPHPARVASVSVEITPPYGLPEDRLGPLLAVARHCTLHTTVERPLDVQVDVVLPAVAMD
jgi:putative redox protein